MQKYFLYVNGMNSINENKKQSKLQLRWHNEKKKRNYSPIQNKNQNKMKTMSMVFLEENTKIHTIDPPGLVALAL